MKPFFTLIWPRHGAALGFLTLGCALLWCDVLFTHQVLLPGAMLGGFAPFGADPNAPWTILHWDALAQYYPWRAFAARELLEGRVPLWNPHQFAGTPFLANGQSAVFYPLNLPFWMFDTARAFGIAAFLHSVLASWGAYFLTQRWQLSRLSSIAAAIAFALGGYLMAWNALPTLAQTASWLPLLLCLFERALVRDSACKYLQVRWSRVAWFGLALSCALLAGHAQVWAFCLFALGLRALTLPLRSSLQVLAGGAVWAILLSALQWLPTLELARLGHRAAQGGPSADGWAGIAQRALNFSELPSLLVGNWPMNWGSLNENFAYQGALCIALATLGLVSLGTHREHLSPRIFALILTGCGLIYGMALPPSNVAYFTIPGWSQLGGAGRALLWWSLGAALLCGFGLEWLRGVLRRRELSASTCSIVLGAIIALMGIELGFSAWTHRVTAPRETIYPNTQLTKWLQANVKPSERIAFITPRESWLPREVLGPNFGRNHPPGVLPPNGAMVYGLNDVGGYDSLASLKYREFINSGEGRDIAPQLNGNILFPSAGSARFSALNVRYVVTLEAAPAVEAAQIAWRGEGVVVWRRTGGLAARQSGANFFPGWRDGVFQPQSFRLGTWLCACALAFFVALNVAASTCRAKRDANR